MKIRPTTDKHDSSKLVHAPADDFVILSSDECASVPTLEQKSIFAQLEADLLSQLKVRIKMYIIKCIFSNIQRFIKDVLR
jgi:hypothetical protein